MSVADAEPAAVTPSDVTMALAALWAASPHLAISPQDSQPGRAVSLRLAARPGRQGKQAGGRPS